MVETYDTRGRRGRKSHYVRYTFIDESTHAERKESASITNPAAYQPGDSVPVQYLSASEGASRLHGDHNYAGLALFASGLLFMGITLRKLYRDVQDSKKPWSEYKKTARR